MVSDITYISLYDITGTNIILSGDLDVYGRATVGDILNELGASNFGVTLVSETPGGEAISNDALYVDHFNIGGQASMYDASIQPEIIESLYNNGQEYKIEAVNGVPKGGTAGQVLTKTSSGCGWQELDTGQKYVDFEMIAGGGGAGWSFYCNYTGGGGGAGGYIKKIEYQLLSNSCPVVVGAGGTGGTDATIPPTNGGDSKFGRIVAYGGGRGGQYNNHDGQNCLPYNGGSGGGAYNTQEYGIMALGIDGQGHNGNWICTCGGCVGTWAAGGGGVMQQGQGYYGNCLNYGEHGQGLFSKFGGVDRYLGWGGNACPKCSGCGCGGDGTKGYGSGSAGGCGIVVVRYPADGSYGINCATGGTVTTCTIDGTSYKIHTFTSNGTFCVVS